MRQTDRQTSDSECHRSMWTYIYKPYNFTDIALGSCLYDSMRQQYRPDAKCYGFEAIMPNFTLIGAGYEDHNTTPRHQLK